MSKLSYLVADAETLQAFINGITAYEAACEQNLQDALDRLGEQSGEWNDEDYNALASAIASFKTNISDLGIQGEALKAQAAQKIAKIDALHAIKI